MVLWLKLHAPSAEGPGLIPGQGIKSYTLQRRWKILYAATRTQRSQIKE